MSKPTLFFLYIIGVSIFLCFHSNFCCAFNSSFTQNLSEKDTLPPYSYLQKAAFLQKNDSLEKAILYIQHAQRIYQKKQEWSAYIDCIPMLVDSYIESDLIEKGKEAVDLALLMAKKHLYEKHPSLGNVFKYKSELYLYELQLDSSEYYLHRAIDVFICEKDWKNYGWSKALTGIIAFYTEDYSNMECDLNEGLKIAYTLEDKVSKSELSANLLQSLGALYETKGDYDKALEVSQKALLLQTNNIEKVKIDSNSIGAVYNNIGAIFFAKSDYQQAVDFLERSMEIYKKRGGENSIDCAESYANVGLAHLYQKEFIQALEYFDKSLNITKNSTDSRGVRNTIDCYENLSQSYFDLGDYDKSFSFAQKALDINNKNKWDLDITYDQLSAVHKERKNFKEALTLNQKALKIRKEKFGERNPKVAISYRRMAEIYRELNQIDTALYYCQKALIAVSLRFDEENISRNPDIEDVNDMGDFKKILTLKGELLTLLFENDNQIDDLKNALNAFELAIKVIDAMRHGFQSEASKHTLAANALPVYEKSIKVAIQLSNWIENQNNTPSDSASNLLKKAFQFAEKNKATILLEAIKESKARLFLNIPTAILDREESLKRDMAFYERKLFEEKQKPAEKASQIKMSFWESKIFDLTQAHQGLSDTLERDYPDYYHLKYNAEVASVEALQAELKERNETLLEYFVGKNEIYVFVLTADKIEVHQIANDEDLQFQFETLLQSLKVNLFQTADKEKNYSAYIESAHWIYKKLVGNVLPLKKSEDEVGQLIVIPDGVMGYIPFEALLVEYPQNPQKMDFGLNDINYLLEDYSIGYAYSANLFLEGLATKASQKEQNYVGYAPVFAKQLTLNKLKNIRSCSEAELQPLEGSEREVEQLQKMMDGTVFLKEEASKENFIKNGGDGRILHLATHACLSEEDPMFNTIHFVNDYLSTYELFNIRLNVDLAILSACNTGSGTLVRGEGIMSLSRGFLYAGCPSIVTSLWNVNDNAAVDIMLNLHANLMEGQSKNDALRSAKLQYLQNKPNRLSVPYFWATFVHIGNPKPIELKSVSTGFYWLLSMFIFGFGSLYLIGRKMRFSK